MELQLEGLSKTYGTVQALRKVTYTFKPGIYGILGANGAGKSTMINLIMSAGTAAVTAAKFYMTEKIF